MIIGLLLPLAVISRTADHMKKRTKGMKKKRRKTRKKDPLKQLKGFY